MTHAGELVTLTHETRALDERPGDDGRRRRGQLITQGVAAGRRATPWTWCWDDMGGKEAGRAVDAIRAREEESGGKSRHRQTEIGHGQRRKRSSGGAMVLASSLVDHDVTPMSYEVMVAAIGSYLGSYRWDHFVTLSTQGGVSNARLDCEFRQYVRQLARSTQGPIAWVYFMECEAGGHGLHLHALLAGTGALTTKRIEKRWLGNTRVSVYDPTRGARWYVPKGIARNWVHWDVSWREAPRQGDVACA